MTMNRILKAAALFVTLTIAPTCTTPTITGEAAHRLVTEQGALLVDVRTPEEFGSGHVDGALNVPVGELEAKLATFPAKKNQNVLVYCRSGRRSAKAAMILTKAGFTKVYGLGGMSNWK